MAIEEKELLIHWWICGGVIYTTDELETFEKVIDKYGVNKILDVAIASYICSGSSPATMIMSIRNNNVEKLLNSLPDVSQMKEKTRMHYEDAKRELIKELSESYERIRSCN